MSVPWHIQSSLYCELNSELSIALHRTVSSRNARLASSPPPPPLSGFSVSFPALSSPLASAALTLTLHFIWLDIINDKKLGSKSSIKQDTCCGGWSGLGAQLSQAGKWEAAARQRWRPSPAVTSEAACRSSRRESS